MPKRFVGFIAALVVLLVVMLAPAAGVISPPSVHANQVSVSIVDLAFSSANITVNVGDTVKWTNNGAVPHTVTSAGGPLDSGQLAPGETYEFTFATAGTYDYKCLNHASMTGTVNVVTSNPTPTKTATPKPPTASIKLDKDKSKYNGVVKATFAGFTPGKTIKVSWPNGTILLQATANSTGTAAGSFRTPLSPLGNYQVTAKDSAGKSATATLRVIPRIMLAPTSSGPIGTEIRVYLYGFSPGDSVDVRWYAPEGVHFQVIRNIPIADTGRGSKLVIIPAGSALGSHKISGNVIGVSRSTSTTFIVTAGAASSADTAHVAQAPTLEPTLVVTNTPVMDETTNPPLTETLSPTSTSTIYVTETPTGVTGTATKNPTETKVTDVDPATPTG
jgi:plastocyanin